MPARLVLALLLMVGLAAAAPPPPGASRAELARWLGELGDSGTDIATPLRWRYVFAAADGRALERLSVALDDLTALARSHGTRYTGIAPP